MGQARAQGDPGPHADRRADGRLMRAPIRAGLAAVAAAALLGGGLTAVAASATGGQAAHAVAAKKKPRRAPSTWPTTSTRPPG